MMNNQEMVTAKGYAYLLTALVILWPLFSIISRMCLIKNIVPDYPQRRIMGFSLEICLQPRDFRF